MLKLDLETSSNQFIDAYQVYDRRLAGYEFFILVKVNGCRDDKYVKSFMTVTSFNDGTFIEMFDSDTSFIGASVINRFQVIDVGVIAHTIRACIPLRVQCYVVAIKGNNAEVSQIIRKINIFKTDVKSIATALCLPKQ